MSVFLLFCRWIKIKGTNTKKKRIKEIGSDIFYPLVLNVAPNETVEKPKLEVFYSVRARTMLGSRKKLEARKILENAAESHLSSARDVRRGFEYYLI